MCCPCDKFFSELFHCFSFEELKYEPISNQGLSDLFFNAHMALQAIANYSPKNRYQQTSHNPPIPDEFYKLLRSTSLNFGDLVVGATLYDQKIYPQVIAHTIVTHDFMTCFVSACVSTTRLINRKISEYVQHKLCYTIETVTKQAYFPILVKQAFHEPNLPYLALVKKHLNIPVLLAVLSNTHVKPITHLKGNPMPLGALWGKQIVATLSVLTQGVGKNYFLLNESTDNPFKEGLFPLIACALIVNGFFPVDDDYKMQNHPDDLQIESKRIPMLFDLHKNIILSEPPNNVACCIQPNDQILLLNKTKQLEQIFFNE